MSLQAYYNAFRAAPWAHSDPDVCGCRGSGWALSDVDTWHECPIHHVEGQRHPEDDFDPEDYEVEPEPRTALERVIEDDVLAPERLVVGRRFGTPVYAPVESDDIPF
jgi:hypothetical protein